MTQLIVNHRGVSTWNEQLGEYTEQAPDVYNIEPGDFLSAFMVTDTTVYEVIKTTTHSITMRSTRSGDTLKKEGMTVYSEAVSDPNGEVRTVRRCKDGSFKIFRKDGVLSPARRINGKPVCRVNYAF